MAPKRPNATEDMTGREKKKLKVFAARTIAIQSTSNVANVNPESGQQTNSLSGLPSTIDVEKFVEARAFEIDAMHNAMKTASASSTHRVWQTLPRHLRRRAASHDVRRVPLRIRERAAAEMDPARKKAPTRSIPKAGKFKQIPRTTSLLKRQKDKKWLETHLWHAKRMHMKNMWGYRLAVSPTEKAYRPSHRASMHDSILHDASYYSCIEVKGPEKMLISMLESFCDPQGPGPGAKRFLGGARAVETHIYKRNAYPYDLISPLTIIWKAQQGTAIDRKGKGKGSEVRFSATEFNSSEIRSILLRFHPSANKSVMDILKDSASFVLEAHNKSHEDQQETRLEVINLGGHFNVFEIMGPRSSQILHGCLSPVHSTDRTEFSHFWASFANLQSAGSVPRGMVIGFKVLDPRLKFPPKNTKSKTNNADYIHDLPIAFPSSQLAESDIWDEKTRNGLAKPRFKKKDLDERRSKNEIPGTALNALRQDDRIPVILIQRSLDSSSSTDTQSVHGWTLMVPAGWGMPFFSSLIFTSTRIAGQFERQTQAYESGIVYFPRDYPTTESYEEYASERAVNEKATWDRKPPAKRVNYEKLCTEDPWKVDWTRILGMDSKVGSEDHNFMSTQREIPTTKDEHTKLWLLRGSEVPRILSSLSSVFNHGAALLSEVNRLRLKRGLSPLSTDVNTGDLLQGALVNVKVTMSTKGSPQDFALLYTLSDDVWRKWGKLIKQKSLCSGKDSESPEENELASIIPDNIAIVGSITTGHYSLARGHGFAIGAISLCHLLALEQQCIRLHPNHKAPSKAIPIFVGVRNIEGHQCRVAAVEVFSDV